MSIQQSRYCLRANAAIRLNDPVAALEALCTRFEDYGRVERSGRMATIETVYGLAQLDARDRHLALEALGDDETNFAYVKLSLAEHLLSLGEEKPEIVWTGDGAAGTPLPYFREMEVVEAFDIGPHMRRVRLRGQDLGRFAEGGYHIRLLIPPSQQALQWPVTGADGRPVWPDEQHRPTIRIYTMRRIDVAKGEIEVDFVLHEGEDMPGAEFAIKTRPGDRVGITGPGGGTVGKARRYLLAGDETALPAIARILEELPAHAEVTAYIEVDGQGDEMALASSAQARICWLHRNGAPPGATALLPEAVASHDWTARTEDLFAWVGCEFTAFRSIRTYLRKVRMLPREQQLVVAYWRRGFDGDNARTNEA